jgi:hypothetical protein
VVRSQALITTLGEALVIGPEQVYLDHRMLVITGIEWEADLSVLRHGLSKKRREFKGPFRDSEPDKLLRKQLKRLGAHADRVFKTLYPNFVSVQTRPSWRPMITGPEPLHFDTYGGDAPLITSFINVSKVPRKYCVGPSFADLIVEQPNLMRELVETGTDKFDLSYLIRQRTAEGLPPLGPDTARQHIDMAPGSIWFFNAKTVSHEVVYGEGAFGISWEIPHCGAASQADLLKGLT